MRVYVHKFFNRLYLKSRIIKKLMIMQYFIIYFKTL